MNTTSTRDLLPGFEYRRADVEGTEVNHAIGGSGPPVLLLHGYPENHLMWRQVAPVLAKDHTVVFIPEEAPGLVSAALRDFLG